jgi:molybdate-binding protein
VGGCEWLYPAEVIARDTTWHDGVYQDGELREHADVDPRNTLVIAGCDPAAGLLATHYTRHTGFRLLVLPRSSCDALELLQQGLVHAAGTHLSTPTARGNVELVQRRLQGRHALIRVAQWEEGVATNRLTRLTSTTELFKPSFRWIGREPGSGARHCLEELFGDRPVPRRIARDHRGVADAIQCGWADAGVCVRLVSEESGLAFLPVRVEHYDLCVAASQLDDRRVQLLIEVLRSADYRSYLEELPGYRSTETGEIILVDSSAS